jgi:hypothetical protein
MTNLYPNSSIQNTSAEGGGPGQPGGAPVPGGTLATGNPQESQYQPFGVQPPVPENPVQQLLGTQVSNGQMPAHQHPNTVVLAQPGTDSLLAQMSRGQTIMADSTYGLGGFVPQNGGCSPQVPSPPANITQPILARVASGVTVPVPPVYTGT